MASTLNEARAAKAGALTTFARLADVVGVGITRHADGYALKVNLRAPPAAGVDLPVSIDGVPVDIEVTGHVDTR